MKNLYFLALPILIAIVFSFLILNYELLEFNEAEETDELTSESLINGGSPILGNSNAKITILEFGDYQCTFCYKFHQNILPTLITEYVDSGKVKMVFKDFPLNGDESVIAGEATYCADDQGQYWNYHNMLYENWAGERTGWIKFQILYQFAKDLNLDLDEFTNCLNNHVHLNRVLENEKYGDKIHVDGTPTFMIFNDEKLIRIVGTQPIDVFRQVINEF